MCYFSEALLYAECLHSHISMSLHLYKKFIKTPMSFLSTLPNLNLLFINYIERGWGRDASLDRCDIWCRHSRGQEEFTIIKTCTIYSTDDNVLSVGGSLTLILTEISPTQLDRYSGNSSSFACCGLGFCEPTWAGPQGVLAANPPSFHQAQCKPVQYFFA